MRTPDWKVLSIFMKQQAADDETTIRMTYDIGTVVEVKLPSCGKRGANRLDDDGPLISWRNQSIIAGKKDSSFTSEQD